MKILLTGGHSGIGLELTKKLLKEGHQLGLIVRNEKRKVDAIQAIGSTDNIDFFYADLSKRGDVYKVAEEVKAKWDNIDGLFNNAGVLLEKAVYSEKGNEMQFEVNALTPYFLTKELKPLFDKSDNAFVVNTATGAMHKQKSLDIDNLKRPKKFVKLMGSYMNSKFALVLLMNHLGKEWSNSNIRVINVDPGPNKTGMTAGSGMPFWLKPIRNLFFPAPIKGANKIYDAAFSPSFSGKTGIYITGDKINEVQYQLNDSEFKNMLDI